MSHDLGLGSTEPNQFRYPRRPRYFVKQESGGLLLLRRITPLPRRNAVYFYSGAYTARGELRRGLPVGFVWGEKDGEVCFHPDESVVSTVRTVFSKFTELGSVRKVWLWFRSEGLSFPLRSHMKSEIRWVAPSYHTIHQVLTNPVYAGAYAYGKSHRERYVDDQGRLRKRTRLLPMAEWPVLLPEHHPGFTPKELQVWEVASSGRNWRECIAKSLS